MTNINDTAKLIMQDKRSSKELYDSILGRIRQMYNGKLPEAEVHEAARRLMVVKTALEEVIEPIFHENSYGFRPKHSAHQALAVTRRRCWEYNWVLDVDIKQFFDTLDHDLLMRAVRYHIKEIWVILYIERWLKASIYKQEGIVERRSRGVPQGGVISPLLANLYLHYTFDLWMESKHKGGCFARYADDIVIHCCSLRQAEQIKQSLELRLETCKLSLHPDKTRIIYCQDDDRTQNYKQYGFMFLGYDFRAYRCAVRSTGRIYRNFSCGIARKSTKRLSNIIRSWKLHRRPWMTLEEIAYNINPIIRGWIQYYGEFRKYDLRHLFRVLNNRLVKWACSKYKNFRYNKSLAREWVKEKVTIKPETLEHWKAGFIII